MRKLGGEAAQFLFWEYRNQNFFAVWADKGMRILVTVQILGLSCGYMTERQEQ
jgi:hypothetical protein